MGGGAAGFAGAFLAHVLTALADRAGAESWLRGPYGPQFMPIALYTGVFYGALGFAAGRRAGTALLGFLGPFLGIAGGMALLTRYAGWGMPRGLPSTPQWQLAVSTLYVVVIWGTIAALGAWCARTTKFRGAAVAAGSALAAYALLTFVLWLVPGYAQSRWNPVSLIPSPINLMDGLLSGACLCLALTIDSRIRRNA